MKQQKTMATKHLLKHLIYLQHICSKRKIAFTFCTACLLSLPTHGIQQYISLGMGVRQQLHTRSGRVYCSVRVRLTRLFRQRVTFSQLHMLLGDDWSPGLAYFLELRVSVSRLAGFPKDRRLTSTELAILVCTTYS